MLRWALALAILLSFLLLPPPQTQAFGIGMHVLGTGVPAAAGRTLLYSEDFEGTGKPAAWTETIGTPLWDFDDLGDEALQLDSTGSATEKVDLINAWDGSDLLKCYEFSWRRVASTSTTSIIIQAYGPLVSGGSWRIQNSGANGISGRCGGASWSTISIDMGDIAIVQWELDAEAGDCRINVNGTERTITTGTPETAGDEFRSFQMDSEVVTAGNTYNLHNLEVYDGACTF